MVGYRSDSFLVEMLEIVNIVEGPGRKFAHGLDNWGLCNANVS